VNTNGVTRAEIRNVSFELFRFDRPNQLRDH
jgi:hypothetical protein